MIRIANGQGFWGDSLEAPVNQVRRGPIDYLTLDYLAEITMSILQKQRSRDPRAGYARDFVEMIARVLPDLVERRIRVIANAGGVNPAACRDAVLGVAKRQGIDIRVATVAGDDIMDRLDQLIQRGIELRNMDTGEPLSAIRAQVQSANVYFGAFPVADALARGAQIVITGRCTDTGLAMAPMIHEFGWKADDWDKLSAGTIAGHTVECGAQCTGGNCQVDWDTIPDMADIGYPIIEAEPDGTFAITKHAGTGGRVTVASIKEQLLYEASDPGAYLTPDVTADFTAIQLRQVAHDRVSIEGARANGKSPTLKVSIGYLAGYLGEGELSYAGRNALARAKLAGKIIRERLAHSFSELRIDYIGSTSSHGRSFDASEHPYEVRLRVAARARSADEASLVGEEVEALYLNGPAGGGGARKYVVEQIGIVSTLLDRSEVSTSVTLKDWTNEPATV